MKFIILLLITSSCGWYGRQKASVFGGVIELCHEGVSYVQMTSGASVQYDTNGKIKGCK